MLLFELFPAFLMLVSIAVGVSLFLVNRRMTARGEEDEPRSTSQPAVTADSDEEDRSARPRRPSMSA